MATFFRSGSRLISTCRTAFNLEQRLTNLKYDNKEVMWIKAFKDAYDKGHRDDPMKYRPVSDCGHTGETYQYTKNIVDSIEKMGLDKWEKETKHQNYLSNDLYQQLVKLGYNHPEALWIVAFKNAYDKGYKHEPMKFKEVDDCGHSGGTYNYTKRIVDSIEKMGFNKWTQEWKHRNYTLSDMPTLRLYSAS